MNCMNNQQVNELHNPLLNKVSILLYCPKCNSYRYGNYCEECGTKLIEIPRQKCKCPYCGGSGEIDSPIPDIKPPRDPYTWGCFK